MRQYITSTVYMHGKRTGEFDFSAYAYCEKEIPFDSMIHVEDLIFKAIKARINTYFDFIVEVQITEEVRVVGIEPPNVNVQLIKIFEAHTGVQFSEEAFKLFSLAMLGIQVVVIK